MKKRKEARAKKIKKRNGARDVKTKVINRAHADTRVPVGIPNFDRLIEGGFEKNSINLFVGDSGSGKTIFAVQFLVTGIAKGETCLYVTFEEKKDEFYSNMKNFGWDLEKYEKQGKLIFLEYTPEKVKTMLEEGGGIIESIVLGKKVHRIVIDSITSFALLFDDDLKRREASLELFSMLRKWGCTSLLTYEEEPIAEKKTTSKTLEFESDSITAIYYIRTKRERKRFVEVLKMRGTKHSREIFPLEISKNGISIGTRAYSGKI